MKQEKELLSAEAMTELVEEKVGENVADDVYDALDFMAEYQAQWQRNQPWKGYEVYSPVFTGKAPVIGLPSVILVKAGEARLSTPEESQEYMEIICGE